MSLLISLTTWGISHFSYNSNISYLQPEKVPIIIHPKPQHKSIILLDYLLKNSITTKHNDIKLFYISLQIGPFKMCLKIIILTDKILSVRGGCGLVLFLSKLLLFLTICRIRTCLLWFWITCFKYYTKSIIYKKDIPCEDRIVWLVN